MSKLHDALKCLRPKDFSDVPVDDLENFMRDTFANAEVIVNSVPSPPGGSDFESATRTRKDVNGARNASEMTLSEARPPPVDPSFEELHNSWGKPAKLSQKDNPLGITVYKMAGGDRHGAWFARHSIHEGLGFTKWKKAMQREFGESLAKQGGPGEGAVRGIGGDRRLEEKVIDGLGKMEVLQVSAQFPGPTAPREFVTLLLTSDNALSEKSKPRTQQRGAEGIPRHYIVVSIPCKHPDAPPREGLVLGHYESVEMIREIPLTSPKQSSDSGRRDPKEDDGINGGSIARKEEGGDDDPETNPVEWVMITRSDPGGGIPRFMVERGTPGSIAADVVKFLNWACAKEEIPDPDEDKDQQNQVSENVAQEQAQPNGQAGYSAAAGSGHGAGVGTSIADDRSLTANYEAQQPGQGGGLMSSLTSALENGIAAYAPESVQQYLKSSPQSSEPTSASDESSETSSIDSFASAEQYATATDGEETPPAGIIGRISTDSLASTATKSPSGQSRYEKELQKIDARRNALDEKLRKTREKEESRTQQISEKEAREKRKAEEKYEKEMAKLHAKRDKEARKLEAKRLKEADKNDKAKLVRERDEWKDRFDMAERENRLLKEQLGELQHENTLLVQRIGKTEIGQQALKQVSQEISRPRSGSSASRKSLKSK